MGVCLTSIGDRIVHSYPSLSYFIIYIYILFIYIYIYVLYVIYIYIYIIYNIYICVYLTIVQNS